MVLMAIDHASFFIARVHPSEYWGHPLPRYSNIFAFITRFLTHPCAPGFFFIMGIGMILFASSRRELGWSEGKIMRFFVLRGLMLIGLGLMVVNFAWLLGLIGSRVDFHKPGPGGGGEVALAFLVLSALGFSMILSSLLLRSGPVIAIGIGFAAIFAVQLLIPSAEHVNVLFSPLKRILLIPGQTGILSVSYPIIPWLGICCLGLGFGSILIKNRQKAFQNAFYSGIVFVLLFFVVRGVGGFGNFHKPGPGLIGFLNVTKYPPSLSYVLLMLGINLLLLVLFEKARKGLQKWGGPLLTFGKAALFFYVLHMYMFALLGFAFPYGSKLPLIYPFWILLLFLLYLLCRWYGNFKKRTSPESVWRFF
jgi:uncharacterized membrane protein